MYTVIIHVHVHYTCMYNVCECWRRTRYMYLYISKYKVCVHVKTCVYIETCLKDKETHK